MREHIFKAKRVDNGEWVEGDFLSNAPNRIGDKHAHIATNDSMWHYTGKNFIQVLPETVCEFTGRLDKNLKKTFTGDRAKLKDHTAIYVCMFSEVRSCFYWQCEVTNEIRPLTIESEIIGNIHDEGEK